MYRDCVMSKDKVWKWVREFQKGWRVFMMVCFLHGRARPQTTGLSVEFLKGFVCESVNSLSGHLTNFLPTFFYRIK